ncbi:ubiquitin-protein ligase-like, putative [Trypanosoma cruzi marinkellei]|uniref:Ubiquitin-protein ligase-like, putative n=1 Tax=Trypanosoma cruzi marinkellei TaxID=85056 RepID=K2NFQ1_TRYCR|nr:ubiquitin-protein ligase-like, putative [Trypanosoma cruzi marinkellei]
MMAFLVLCRMCPGSVCRPNAQRILEGVGGLNCGCRRYGSRNETSAKGAFRGALSPSMSKEAKPTLSSLPIAQKLLYDLPIQLQELLRLNHWQEAIRLISSFSSSQKEGVEATPLASSCESLIAALLYHGHGESAFTLWRIASTNFDFAPSPMTMMKLAVYTLLVDRKAQEALDLVAMATIPLESKAVAEEALLELIALWTTVFAAISPDEEKNLQEKHVELEQKVEKALVDLLRLSLQTARKGDTQLNAEGLQLALHALLSLTLLRDGSEVLHGIISSSFLESDDPSVGTLFRVAEILSMKPFDYNTTAFFSDDVSFLITHIFLLPLVWSSKNSTPLLLGLEVYRSFFIAKPEPLSSEVGNAYFPFTDNASTSNTTTTTTDDASAAHTTVGNVFLRRLVQNNLEKSFLYSVVLHDMNASRTSLMTHLLETPIKRDLCDLLSHRFGKQFISVVKECSLSGTQRMPFLGYVSRALSSAVSKDARQSETGPHIGVGTCTSIVCRNKIFYLELLSNLITEVPVAELKAWRRFVVLVTDAIIRDTDGSAPATISQELQLQLHLRWWLPELLAMVDTTRECSLRVAPQRAVPPGAITEWDQSVCMILRTLHRKEYRNRSENPLGWASLDSAIGEDVHNTDEASEVSHDVSRLLVRRVVRWEWLLKGLWDFARESRHNGNQSTWNNLLDVCVGTLNHCRVFHRHDIARDLIETLFLPAAPFLPPLADSPREGTSCDTTLIALLINGPNDTLRTSTTLKELRWCLVDEMSRWMPAFQGWAFMRELQVLLPSFPHDAKKTFISLEHLITDLLNGEGKDEVPGTRERERVGKVFEWYEEACRNDLSLRTPQLLCPLSRAMRRASLLDCFSELMKNTFWDIQRGFHAPRPSSASRLLVEALIFYYAHHAVATTRARLGGDADILLELSNTAYDNARNMVAAFAENYILALWKEDCFPALEAMLLKPAAPNEGSNASSTSSVLTFPKAMSHKEYFFSSEIAYLLPEGEREALRLFLLLTFAQRCEGFLYTTVLGRLPRSKTDPARVAAFVDRLVAEEPCLFSSLGALAQQAARGKWRLREVCASIAASHEKGGAKEQVTKTRIGDRNHVRTVREINRCIDNCDWVKALRAIPHVLSDPLHVARKALLACEKAPKGATWEGTMSVFVNSRHLWEQVSPKKNQEQKKLGDSSRLRAAIGIQECGRIMTLLADARRWCEALRVFELLGPYGMDGFTFSQACYALRTGGHPELAIDLWAMWRAYVGDAVEPTAQMCKHFLRCGVVGNTTVADAACVMLKLAVHAYARQKVTATQEGLSSPNDDCTPGTTLPLSIEKEENTITALLRDRWHESWQEALRVALVSERPSIIHAVARESPSNYHLYEAVMQHVTRAHRNLSMEERSAIAGHLDLKTALNPQGNSVDSGEDRAARVLRELLGDEEGD